MPPPLDAAALLDRLFLEIRARLLEVAAALDRIERADGAEAARQDLRLEQIAEAVEILNSDGFDRAERIQMLFSDPYVAGWTRKQHSGGNGSHTD